MNEAIKKKKLNHDQLNICNEHELNKITWESVGGRVAAAVIPVGAGYPPVSA
jgi:hypothetical protein